MATKAKQIDISNLTKDQAMTKLIQSGLTFKEAEKEWKENGSAIRGGVFQAVLDYLAEQDRTQRDLAQYVLDHGTGNEARWFGQRDAIRRLSVQVRGNKAFKEVSMTAEQEAGLKAKYTSAS